MCKGKFFYHSRHLTVCLLLLLVILLVVPLESSAQQDNFSVTLAVERVNANNLRLTAQSTGRANVEYRFDTRVMCSGTNYSVIRNYSTDPVFIWEGAEDELIYEMVVHAISPENHYQGAYVVFANFHAEYEVTPFNHVFLTAVQEGNNVKLKALPQGGSNIIYQFVFSDDQGQTYRDVRGTDTYCLVPTFTWTEAEVGIEYYFAVHAVEITSGFPFVYRGDFTVFTLSDNDSIDYEDLPEFTPPEIHLPEIDLDLIPLNPSNPLFTVYNKDRCSWHATIQGAINAAEHGHTIIAYPNVYRENIDFNGKRITLQSKDPSDPNIRANTVIVGDENQWSNIRIMRREDRNTVLSGFTIKNCYGIYIADASPVICCNDFKDNSIANGGSAMLVRSSALIVNNTFINNAGNRGGAIFISEGSPEIINNSFMYNRAQFGGAIYMKNTIPVIMRNNFIRNDSHCGGAVYVTEFSAPVISSNYFLENWARQKGGAIYVDNFVGAKVRKTNCQQWVIQNSPPHMEPTNRYSGNVQGENKEYSWGADVYFSF